MLSYEAKRVWVYVPTNGIMSQFVTIPAIEKKEALFF
jgi:hypothetical protein